MPFVSLPGRKLEVHYEDAGEGEPVVLIGGFSSTIETWRLQIGPLAEHFRVIAPDNRGSGATRITADDGVRNPQVWAEDVLALIDALKLDRIHLVGCSMGGFISQAFAVQHQDRLRSLTLMCSTPGGANTVPVPPEVMRGVLVGSVPGASPEDMAALSVAALHADTLTKNPQAWEIFRKSREAEPHSPEELASRQKGIAGFTVWEQLARLQVPTLVATGDGDRLVPPENAKVIAGRIPGAELKVIADGGHAFFIEQPKAVNAMLIDFISRHSGG